MPWAQRSARAECQISLLSLSSSAFPFPLVHAFQAVVNMEATFALYTVKIKETLSHVTPGACKHWAFNTCT